MIHKAEKYLGKFLETKNDSWFTELVGTGKTYQHWGVAAVKALFEWKELQTIDAPVEGCFALIKDSEGHEWAGVVTEVLGDSVRVIEFGTTANYNLNGSEYGYGVHRKRRAISAYAEFCLPITHYKNPASIPIPTHGEAKPEIVVFDEIKQNKPTQQNQNFGKSKMKDYNKVSKDAPPSQSLADNKQQSVKA